jgi:DNA-binding XRE family transcriptional regulator
LGARIRAERARQSLSQAALAQLIGCSQKAVSQWESGARTHISPRYAVRMCRALPGLNPLEVFRLVAASENAAAGDAAPSAMAPGVEARPTVFTAVNSVSTAEVVTSEILSLLTATGAYAGAGADRSALAADSSMDGYVDALTLAHERASARVAGGEFGAASADFELLAQLSSDLNMLYRLGWARSLLALGRADAAADLLASIEGRVSLLAQALLESIPGSAEELS